MAERPPRAECVAVWSALMIGQVAASVVHFGVAKMLAAAAEILARGL